MVLRKIKDAAKKLAGKSSDTGAYSLKQILRLRYVVEVMDDAEVDKIKKSYDTAPEEVKLALSEKLRKLETVFNSVKSEKDPQKQKAILLGALGEGISGMKSKVANLKRDAMKGAESKQHAKELASVEEKLASI